MKLKLVISLCISMVMRMEIATANFISANPSNYTTYTGSLLPGDTLYLAAGNYVNQLYLNNRKGQQGNPIVIMGDGVSTVLLANACCNTINITNCAYLVISDLKIDGQHINYVDGVKAGGGGNVLSHHITLENLLIVNNGGNIEGDNQTVGISTKCAAWKWTIRNCIIIGAGTGIYLGNSDGTSPFVGGLIENNLVINTRGYNMQIKAQLDNVRSIFPETSNDSQKTIIRYNVWSKESGSTPIGVGDGSRPCVLMDNFPSTGYGSHDQYEVYGNFFYNNPTEALLQVTGNTTAYNNIFVNHVAPSGFPPVVMNAHNGFPPRIMNVFHNTVITNSDEAGIGLYSANTNYQQYCYANAVFSNGTHITGFPTANNKDNITDTYNDAINYVNNPSPALADLDLYPIPAQLEGSVTNESLFTSYTDYQIDFNGNPYQWNFRGAYSGAGSNPGWKLKLDTMPTPHGTITDTEDQRSVNNITGIIYPNPATHEVTIDLQNTINTSYVITLCDLEGRPIQILYSADVHHGQNQINLTLPQLVSGFYFVTIDLGKKRLSKKVLIWQEQ
jgi:hypothetical protein